jgi:hypothetical protein
LDVVSPRLNISQLTPLYLQVKAPIRESGQPFCALQVSASLKGLLLR